jgi:Uma2 family endonuclease
VLNPALLVEVLSPSTESDDRGPKLDGCKLIESVRTVILVAQDQIEIVVHERRSDGSWTRTVHQHGAVELPSVACRLPVAEVFEDLPDP